MGGFCDEEILSEGFLSRGIVSGGILVVGFFSGGILSGYSRYVLSYLWVARRLLFLDASHGRPSPLASVGRISRQAS